MHRLTRILATIGLAVGFAAAVGPLTAAAAPGPSGGWPGGGGEAVFVQTNDPAGNQVVVYQSGPNGALAPAGRYDTGGDGIALTGAVVDDLASQGSLAYDTVDHLLVAVNGGSNTITVFRVDGTRLLGARTIPSGGTIPVSVAVGQGAIYVLNAGRTGEVQGFSTWDLRPIPGSGRSLGLNPTATPQFLNTPGQIGLSSDGRHLVVTTKANGSDIDVFGIGRDGALSATPVVTPSASGVPFGFTFDRAGDLVVTQAANSSLATYAVSPTGHLTIEASVANGMAVLCWVTSADGRVFFGANAGSATVTTYTVGRGGAPAIVAETPTDGGPIDLATNPGGSALYVETGANDLVDVFAVAPYGALTSKGAVSPELPAHSGLEGIAVS